MQFSEFTKSALAFVALLAFSVSLSTGVAFAEESEVAIKVNGESVEKAEIKSRVDRTVERMKSQYGDQISGKQAEQRLKEQAKQRIIKQTVQHLVLKTHAEQSEVSVNAEDVQERIQSTVERFPSKEAFEKALKQEGMSRQDLEEQIREGLLVDRFLNQQLDRVEISDQEARSYYEQNSERFQGKEFDAVKEKVKRALQQMKQRQAQQKLVSELREKSDITIQI